MQLSLQNLIDLYQKTLPAMLNDQQRIEIITSRRSGMLSV